jgi:hypothetical protein
MFLLLACAVDHDDSTAGTSTVYLGPRVEVIDYVCDEPETTRIETVLYPLGAPLMWQVLRSSETDPNVWNDATSEDSYRPGEPLTSITCPQDYVPTRYRITVLFAG